jgi:predicted RNase H-like HicB family nuclease
LAVASQGKTKKEALDNLQEAVDLYLEDEDLRYLSLPKIVGPQITQIKTN